MPSYSVAIRTLGTAGDKYRQLILSLKSQTVQAEGIYVYIAEGFPLPERVADETYIPCPKGMVAQRSLRFEEIASEYILFCDDDLYLPPDSVKTLFDALNSHKADVVSPNAYPNHAMRFGERLKAMLFSGTFPSIRARYAFRIRGSACYSYAIHPQSVMPTQSFAGLCFLLKKSVFLDAHFEEERWLDSFRYSLGDDQVLAYKLFSKGYRLLIHYDTGIEHLDAGAGHVSDKREKYYLAAFLHYIIWFRTIWQPRSGLRRVSAVLSYGFYWTVQYAIAQCSRLTGKCVYKPTELVRAVRDARVYVKSDEFSSIPAWRV